MANRAELETYESVKTWMAFLDQTGSGSEATKLSYTFRLGQICDDLRLSPDEILARAQGDLKGFEKEIAIWYSEKQKVKTRAEAYHIYSVMKSFLHHNGVDLKTKVRQPKPKLRTALSKEELRRILDYSGVKLRAYIHVARDTGLAPIDILELRYRDIKADLEKGIVPCSITKRRERTEVLLHTFLGPEALVALKTYMATKAMKDDSLLFTSYRNRPRPMPYKSLQDLFKRAAKQAGSGAQLYDLRKFFMTNLRSSGCNEVMIKYWSGHSLGVENGYTIPTIDQSREHYKKHYSALSFGEGLAKEEEIEKLRDEVEEMKASIKAMSAHGRILDYEALQEEIKRIRERLEFYDLSEMSDKEKLRKGEEILGKPRKKRMMETRG